MKLADPHSRAAWERFVQFYRPAIFRVVRSRGLQAADAEDLTQDVLVKIAKKVAEFDVNRSGSFRGWLDTMTRNLVIDQLRKHRPCDIGSGNSQVQQRIANEVDREETSTLMEMELQRERLIQACEVVRPQFSDSIWMAFWMTAIEQRSAEDVANELGKSEGAIRVARCRVMQKLKKEVQQDDF